MRPRRTFGTPRPAWIDAGAENLASIRSLDDGIDILLYGCDAMGYGTNSFQLGGRCRLSPI